MPEQERMQGDEQDGYTRHGFAKEQAPNLIDDRHNQHAGAERDETRAQFGAAGDQLPEVVEHMIERRIRLTV